MILGKGYFIRPSMNRENDSKVNSLGHRKRGGSLCDSLVAWVDTDIAGFVLATQAALVQLGKRNNEP